MTKTWGKHFWLFMHSFAECISEKCYNENKMIICNIYTKICNNLPCPDCTKHATKYIKGKMNPTRIPSKEALQRFLYTFHNDVNKRLRKPQFTDFQMYEKANLEIIYKNFEFYFLKNYTPYSGFHNVLHKKNVILHLRDFLKENKNEIRWTS